MKIALITLASRPYFWINDQLADLCDPYANAARLFTSNFGIGGLVTGLLLLTALLRLSQRVAL